MTLDDAMPKARPEYRPQIRDQHQSSAESWPVPTRKDLPRDSGSQSLLSGTAIQYAEFGSQKMDSYS